jgi:ParB family chromosome partitioning protein
LRLEPAQLIEHPKKGDMAREAERLLESTGWLPQLLRTQDLRTQDLPTPALPLADPNAGDCADGG